MAIRKCEHVRANGYICGSPAINKSDYCYFHTAQRDRRLRILANQRSTQPYQLPLLEDAGAIQLAIMDVTNALLANRIEPKRAALVLSALKIASSNAKKLNFKFKASDTQFAHYLPEHFVDHDNLPELEAGEPEPTALPQPKPAAAESNPQSKRA
jgi:hypothetical protein